MTKVAILVESMSRLSGGIKDSLLGFYSENDAYQIDVYAFSDDYSEEDLLEWRGFNVRLYDRKGLPGKFPVNIEMVYDFLALEYHCVHVNGLWGSLNWLGLVYKKRNLQSKLIISPHGMLDPWALKQRRNVKTILLRLFVKKSLAKANFVHALGDSEAESIRKVLATANIRIFPNGIDVPKVPALKNFKVPIDILFLGRIHEKKGVFELLDAIESLNQDEKKLGVNFRFLFIGWGEKNTVKQFEKRVSEVGSNTEYLGPVFGRKKLDYLMGVDYFILPSFSEGLPMSILEAWACGVPSLHSVQCNLDIGFKEGCSIETPPRSTEIKNQLVRVLDISDECYRQMSYAAWKTVNKNFNWRYISREFFHTIN